MSGISDLIGFPWEWQAGYGRFSVEISLILIETLNKKTNKVKVRRRAKRTEAKARKEAKSQTD